MEGRGSATLLYVQFVERSIAMFYCAPTYCFLFYFYFYCFPSFFSPTLIGVPMTPISHYVVFVCVVCVCARLCTWM